MTARLLGMLAATCVLCLPPSSSDARANSARPPARPAGVAVTDLDRRLDVNRMSLVVTNLGSLGFDIAQGGPGLWYPASASSSLMFASGLWLGGLVNGDLRVAVAEYSSEFVPGNMVAGGPGDPTASEHRVWKVKRWTGDPQDSAHVDRAPGPSSVDVLAHHSWSEYMAGAAPRGAPWKLHRLPDTATPDPSDSLDVPGPDLPGDLATWCLFNDADPAAHTNSAGMTAPLGAEVEQVVFGFDDPGPLGDAAFVRWRVRNRSSATWSYFRAGFWSDPDIGTYTDDKVGCDTTLSLGYAYNGAPLDGVYGSAPPALGTLLLDSSPPPVPGLTPGMYAFQAYVNGTDPSSALHTYSALSGRTPDGLDVIDPFGNPTRYYYWGDPLFGSGWLDPVAADKRMLASTAFRDVAPGASLEVWSAILVAPEPGVTAALSGLDCRAALVRSVFASGFARPFPAPGVCVLPRNCPRPAGYWEHACTGAGGYSLQTLGWVAGVVDVLSSSLDFGADPLGGLCATLAQDGDVRQRAYREYAALLSNVAAAGNGLQPAGEQAIVLSATTPVSCPGIPAVDVGELAAKAPATRAVTGTYQNFITTNRRALEGVDVGLSGFNGGAGAMWDFFGSSLDPSTMPDSFPSLTRIAFDHAQLQKAYRFLRNQLADGSPPAVGRGYRYAGFVDVPFTVRDADTNEQLDAAFVEIVVTDDFGTIQPAASQPASFDSTWAPTDDALGGREYLFVSRRPYTGVPRPEFAADGAIFEGTLPVLYALWARLRLPVDVIDDGDAFDFGFGFAPSPGVDALLRDLAGQPLSDPAVATQYAQIADCLEGINRGLTVGPLCDEPTPAFVSLVSAEAEPGLVRVEWQVATPGPLAVERRAAEGEWRELAAASPDGNGRVAIEDRDVQAGLRYAYRLRLASGPAGEVTVEVPGAHRLSLAGFRPNPSSGPLAVAFTLASSAPARIEVVDVAGRRVLARAIERPVAGQRVLALEGVRLAPGVYVVRLEQGSERLVSRGVVLR